MRRSPATNARANRAVGVRAAIVPIFMALPIAAVLATSAPAADCSVLEHRSSDHIRIDIIANGFEGQGQFRSWKDKNGTLNVSGELTMQGEPGDKLAGTCRGRHLKFTRSRPGVFEQAYEGWLFEKSRTEKSYRPLYCFGDSCAEAKCPEGFWCHTVDVIPVNTEAAGTFTHHGSTYGGWYARLSLVEVPR